MQWVARGGCNGLHPEVTNEVTSTANTDAAGVPPTNGQQQQQTKSEQRIEGLIGACAARARKLKEPIDEPRERQRLADGEIDVEDLQCLADELQQKIDERGDRRRRR